MYVPAKLLRVGSAVVKTYRNFGITAPVMSKASDPVQQLFLDKLREYKSKSKDGGFVDPTPEIQKELKNELDRIVRQLGGGAGTDMSKFPDLKFEEPKLDPVSVEFK